MEQGGKLIHQPKGVEPFIVTFTQPLLLAPCIARLQAEPFYGTEVLEIMKSDPLAAKRATAVSNVVEYHVAATIAHIAEQTPGITNYPIQHGTQTENTVFLYGEGGTLVAHEVLPRLRTIAEYDALVTMAGQEQSSTPPTPVLFEVRYPVTQRAKHAAELINSGLRPTTVNTKLRPLVEHFQTPQMGMVLVTNQTAVRPENFFQQNFQAAGGVIVGLTLDTKELQAHFNEENLFGL